MRRPTGRRHLATLHSRGQTTGGGQLITTHGSIGFVDWQVVNTKTTATFAAYLLQPPPGGMWGIAIQRPNSVALWESVAAFPYVMGTLALRWFNDLERDVDVENLMREWGSQEAYQSFMNFMAEERWS